MFVHGTKKLLVKLNSVNIYGSVAQLVASMSGVVLGGVVKVVGSNLARGKIFTASIGSVDLLYPSVCILDLFSISRVDPNQAALVRAA